MSGENADGAKTIERTLVGAFAGLIAVVVVGVLFITAEYRRGLIRVTLAASPRSGCCGSHRPPASPSSRPSRSTRK